MQGCYTVFTTPTARTIDLAKAWVMVRTWVLLHCRLFHGSNTICWLFIQLLKLWNNVKYVSSLWDKKISLNFWLCGTLSRRPIPLSSCFHQVHEKVSLIDLTSNAQSKLSDCSSRRMCVMIWMLYFITRWQGHCHKLGSWRFCWWLCRQGQSSRPSLLSALYVLISLLPAFLPRRFCLFNFRSDISFQVYFLRR